MPRYAIIEIDDGMTVIPLVPEASAEQAALKHGGVVVDPGPYDRYEDAWDAMLAMKTVEEEDEV
jgi:hypothetical protein